MTVETLDKLLQTLLYEFPIREIAVQMPAWVTMLESGHWLQSAVYTSMLDFAARCTGWPTLQQAPPTGV